MTYSCKKLLFAVGMKNLPLAIHGLEEAYGKSAFVCPYCDGWELRDTPLVLIANGEKAVQSTDGMVQQVVLADGTSIPCTGIFFAPKLAAGSELPQALGCQLSDAGTIIVDQYGKTNVSGVYSAGDAATTQYQVVIAASLGSTTAISINSELLAEAWDRQ